MPIDTFFFLKVEFLTLESWNRMTVIVHPAELVKMAEKKKAVECKEH